MEVTSFSSIIFIILKYGLLSSSIWVLLSKKTMYSVLGLILTFIFGACLSIYVGAIFIGFILIVVYVGAVLVFFLFVTMMVNVVQSAPSRLDYYIFFYIGFTILVFFIAELAYQYNCSVAQRVVNFDFIQTIGYQTNATVLGYVLYTQFSICLVICSLVLLIAMVGSIILLLEVDFDSSSSPSINIEKIQSKTQNITDQVETQEFNKLTLKQIVTYYDDI